MNTLSNISAHLRIFSLLFCHSKTRERFSELKYWTVRSQSSSFLFFFIWTQKTYFLYESECRSVFYSFEKKKRTTVNQAVRFNFKLDTILDSLWNILSIEPSLYFFLYRKSRTLWNLKLKWTAKEREKKKTHNPVRQRDRVWWQRRWNTAASINTVLFDRSQFPYTLTHNSPQVIRYNLLYLNHSSFLLLLLSW